ncbi:JmjC domain-containing protein [Kitasatospora mediocidica]|uniref:JmjC domain-containing protein n=1 Tax=Kitasatospora mediocidica TaxID=58352 RepID=UPI000691474F|nr:cupin domain-containing protein [Kitasatospora mediocidica]
MEDNRPTVWLDALCGELRSQWRGKPTVLTAPWCGPVLDLSWYRTLLASGLRAGQVAVLRGREMLPTRDFCRPVKVRGIHSAKALVDSAAQVADPMALIRHLEDGHTVLLPRIEQWNAEVAAITDRLARLLGRDVEAHLSATASGAPCRDPQRDEADVLIVQLNGARGWHIEPDLAGASQGATQLETELTLGRLLYVPSGFARAATGSEGLSIHLSFLAREIGAQQPADARQRLLSAVPTTLAG